MPESEILANDVIARRDLLRLGVGLGATLLLGTAVVGVLQARANSSSLETTPTIELNWHWATFPRGTITGVELDQQPSSANTQATKQYQAIGVALDVLDGAPLERPQLRPVLAIADGKTGAWRIGEPASVDTFGKYYDPETHVIYRAVAIQLGRTTVAAFAFYDELSGGLLSAREATMPLHAQGNHTNPSPHYLLPHAFPNVPVVALGL